MEKFKLNRERDVIQ